MDSSTQLQYRCFVDEDSTHDCHLKSTRVLLAAASSSRRFVSEELVVRYVLQRQVATGLGVDAGASINVVFYVRWPACSVSCGDEMTIFTPAASQPLRFNASPF